MSTVIFELRSGYTLTINYSQYIIYTTDKRFIKDGCHLLQRRWYYEKYIVRIFALIVIFLMAFHLKVK